MKSSKKLEIGGSQSKFSLIPCPKYLFHINLNGFSDKREEDNFKLFNKIIRLVNEYNQNKDYKELKRDKCFWSKK